MNMKRNKHHKMKREIAETSTSQNKEQEQHDLAYYIHDRVELMHQVFSVIKYKELKLMAPACVRNISIDDLQELCTEELLGISSKRLCAILDGGDPPSDTESSSQSATEPLETISLDSISSDEEILSLEDKTKKKKHKHRHHSSKSKRRKSKDRDNEEEADKSKASRAGLTVLELLELQARARAIRAQLQQEQTKPVSDSVGLESSHSTHTQSSEDEVEIKEEPAEVVEISSDEEKPKIEDLEINNQKFKSPEVQTKTVTKRVNDLIITVPQQKTQKIKLNRPKSIPQEPKPKTTSQSNVTTDKSPEKVNKDSSKDKAKKDKAKDTTITKDKKTKDTTTPKDNTITKDKKTKDTTTPKDKHIIDTTLKDKSKAKKKKKKRPSNTSDNDEITLQLSDSEKMDLLEDLDSKNYDAVSSDSCSDAESDGEAAKNVTNKQTNVTKERKRSRETRKSKEEAEKNEIPKQYQAENENIAEEVENIGDTEIASVEKKEIETVDNEITNSNIEVINSRSNSQTDDEIEEENKSVVENIEATLQTDEMLVTVNENAYIPNESTENIKKIEELPTEENSQVKPDTTSKELSEGELSDRESSEVETIELKPEVVCISDEEDGKPKKKKKKKDKKSKKEKKGKKKDFRESGDQNFHNITTQTSTKDAVTTTEVVDNLSQPLEHAQDIKEDTVEIDLTAPDKSQDSTIEVQEPADQLSDTNNPDVQEDSTNEIVEISDEVYELSDDSSNEDETETHNVLSKEPTTSEIEALSAKIDEIERVEVITEEEIKEYESNKADEEVNMSWKDRYLESKKVKKVLNTSNILNALRKKNRELKKRLEESKVQEAIQESIEDAQEEDKDSDVAEGSIDQYNTLEGSTKFVNPVKEAPINDNLKKDAKQLLKMYKKLLKYNDMSKKSDPNKRKKKKNKKSKKEKTGAEDVVDDKTDA